MPLMRFLLDTSSTVIAPGAGGGTTAAGTGAAEGGILGVFAGNPVMLIVVYCVALFVIMYFFSIRPNQKKEKQMAEMRDAIAVGDSVLTKTGFYGKVVDITYECFIVEFGLNKGVRVPIVKSEIFGKREPNLSNEAPAPVEEEAPKKKGLFGR